MIKFVIRCDMNPIERILNTIPYSFDERVDDDVYALVTKEITDKTNIMRISNRIYMKIAYGGW